MLLATSFTDTSRTKKPAQCRGLALRSVYFGGNYFKICGWIFKFGVSYVFIATLQAGCNLGAIAVITGTSDDPWVERPLLAGWASNVRRHQWLCLVLNARYGCDRPLHQIPALRGCNTHARRWNCDWASRPHPWLHRKPVQRAESMRVWWSWQRECHSAASGWIHLDRGSRVRRTSKFEVGAVAGSWCSNTEFYYLLFIFPLNRLALLSLASLPSFKGASSN